MEVLLDQLKNERHRSTTRLTYYNVWRKFNEFVIRLDQIPGTWEKRTSLYCAHLIMDKQLQSSTVKSYISGIKAVLQNDGYDWQDDEVLLHFFTKSCKIKNDMVKIRLPIQKGLLEIILFEIRRRYGDQPYLEAMYVSAFLLAYYGLLRVGEITDSIHSIKAKDVHESKRKKKLLLILYSSKTHGKESIPQQVRILGKRELEVFDNNETHTFITKYVKPSFFCPYAWNRTYMDMRPPISSDQEQIFIFKDGTPLQATHMRRLLRKILKHLKLEPFMYDIHSFRIGRATDLFKAGVPVEQIKQLGRWKSNAVYRYLRN